MHTKHIDVNELDIQLKFCWNFVKDFSSDSMVISWKREASRHLGNNKSAGRHFATLKQGRHFATLASRGCNIFSVLIQVSVPAVILAQVPCRICSLSLHFNKSTVVLSASAMQNLLCTVPSTSRLSSLHKCHAESSPYRFISRSQLSF